MGLLNEYFFYMKLPARNLKLETRNKVPARNKKLETRNKVLIPYCSRVVRI
jgi:hypothetical protein